jgi:predicted nucleic acid-binding protein
VDAFDSDVLIYAIAMGHPAGERVAALLSVAGVDDGGPLGLGSVLLLPEVLSKPLRESVLAEVSALRRFLARLDLRPVDIAIAELSVALGAAYRLKAADAIHLATAVHAGADRFITNNRDDFPKAITEVAITYPDEL